MMSEYVCNIPLGFEFEPTDDELIRAYLVARILGAPLPWNGILDKDLYGAAPWDVFADIHDASGYWTTKKEGGATKKIIYAFTNITKVSKSKADAKRVSRIAGCGTWSGQTCSKDVKNPTTGEMVGCKRMLRFQHANQNSGLGHWIMYEYSLNGIPSDLVLCKIIKRI